MMTENKKAANNRMARNQFALIGICFIIFEAALIYLKYTEDNVLVTMIADRFHYTYESIDFAFNAGVVLIFSLFLIIIFAIVARKNKLDYNGDKLHFNDMLYYTFFAITLSLVGSYISTIFTSYTNYDSNAYLLPIGFSVEEFDFYNYAYIALMVLLFPVIEELLFRKTLLDILKRYGFRFAVVISSLIYALAHNDPRQFIPAFLLGLLLSIITLQYKSVKPAIIIHILNAAFFYIPFILYNIDYRYLYLMIGVVFMITLYYIINPDMLSLRMPLKQKNNNYVFFFRNVAVILMMLLFIAGNFYTLFL